MVKRRPPTRKLPKPTRAVARKKPATRSSIKPAKQQPPSARVAPNPKAKSRTKSTTKRTVHTAARQRVTKALSGKLKATGPRVRKSANTAVTLGTAAGRITIGPGDLINRPRVPPALFPRDPNENFFDSTRAGHAVVRAEDLLALRIELQNLKVQSGNAPRLQKAGKGNAFLVLHFPPQAITEQTFFDARVEGSPDPHPPGSDLLTGPPVRARISGESRLAFAVPDGFDVPYTLAGILEAVEQLPLSVTANALPPGAGEQPVKFRDLFVRDLGKLSVTNRATLTSFALRSLRIATVQGDSATLQLRHASGAAGLVPLKPIVNVKARLRPGVDLGKFRIKPRPTAPTANQTAIELPWRLVLSPHAGERWRHAKVPVSAPDGHTELWHSRLVAPDPDGKIIEPPRPDPQRSVRAVWALTGENSLKPLQSRFPAAGDLPLPNTSPFRMPLDDSDRFQFVHLSSNFSRFGYTPNAVGTNLLMLSALGGWMDTRGAWDPPAGLSVEEWVQRSAMARDHYVRVVYKGFLFPFGHRVAFVKVSERKFHNGARDAKGNPTVEQVSGNSAYLRQRVFVVVRERERRFTNPSLTALDGDSLARQFPFSSIRLVTSVTPNLDSPASSASAIGAWDRELFWPCVNGAPFEFQCVATDIDGRVNRFGLPMIFIGNELANPAPPAHSKPVPQYAAAEQFAQLARTAWNEPSRAGRRVAQFKQQRVALAASLKAGDTAVQADDISFDGFTEIANSQLRIYSDKLSHPVFYPLVETAHVRIPALAQLTGNAKNNAIVWNAHYKKNGFASNQGQVFVDVLPLPGMAQLDFSSQGERAGGFVQPNLQPSAISRLTGPVTGKVANFINGTLDPKDAFPASLSDLPLPLLFGCIPLGEVIEAVADLADKPAQIPKFASEASTQLESFINGLIRLYEFVTKLADQPGRASDAALAAADHTLSDLTEQAEAYAASLVATVKTRIGQLQTALGQVAAQVQTLFDAPVDNAPKLAGLAGALAAAAAAAAQLRSAANAKVNGVALPSGLRQKLLQTAQQLETTLADIGTITTLIAQGKALYTALDAIVGHPQDIGDLLADAARLEARLKAVSAALAPLRATLAASRLLEGAAREAILVAIDAVTQVLGTAAQLAPLIQLLTGDELTVRFDWAPLLNNWALPGADPKTDALFRANDKHGFLVAVEAKVKKNGQSAPKISVTCSLKSFDLVLVAPASFIELNFEKIEFRVASSAKMDVDVKLSDIKFVGPLSFVETLRDLIPLDGFSDPPHLDITPQGIDAGFSLALPNIAIGVFSLTNLSLGAGFTVPFIGQPLSVRFNFCTREQPFNLTVTLFGGGGFFGITLDPHGIQLLEAAFEFGASISIDLGVASGGVHVMAGIYFRMEKDACSLTGYFRLGGYVSVLGLISASLELYLALAYEFETGKCAGIASLTIEVEVLMFSTSVTVTCERKFAGSNGDPGFRDLMGAEPGKALAAELTLITPTTAYPWREYCEAFA